MARKLRVWYPGATYHITSRGNRGSTLFYDEPDREKYLSLLEETREVHPFILHSYCLMTNHTHLQLETLTSHPKDIMRMINSRYAIYFNRRHKLDGHVFQGRYGSELIHSIKHFLEVSRYIHCNPVEASIINHPIQYPWSSYRAYVYGEENPHISTKKTLSFFQDPKIEQYRQFVEKPREVLSVRHNFET